MIEVVLTVAATAVSLPLWLLSVECLASLWPARSDDVGAVPRPKLDVLVPAHDEAATLPETLPEIARQLAPGDRLWVVADNCRDATAEVGRALGARVLKRCCEARRGKGYALDFGLQAIAEDPGDVVVVIDADVTPRPGALDRLALAVAATGRPAQGAYLMPPAPHSRPRDQVSSCAVTLKNLVRPAGLSRLGMPSVITGSGVAFPWEAVRGVRLATGHIVEDMQVYVDLLLAGREPQFCPAAEFTAPLPDARGPARTQRTRWEHGHLQILLAHAPRLLWAAARRRRVSLLAAACDLAIPPLSLLGLTCVAAMVVAGIAGWVQLGWTPLMILLAAAMTSFATVLAGLWRYAPAGIPWRLLLAIPGYAVGKVPIYLGFVFGRQREWVRTARRSGTEASPAAAPPGPHHLSASPESSPQRASEYGNHAALG